MELSLSDCIEGVKMGDEVYFHVTNLEQDWDVPHGFAVKGNNGPRRHATKQRACHAANVKRAGSVRAGRPTHYGAEDIVENAWKT